MENNVILLPASLLMFTAFQNQQKQEKPRNPNIVIIYTDDQGSCDAGAYGTTELKSPNIDKLTISGVQKACN